MHMRHGDHDQLHIVIVHECDFYSNVFVDHISYEHTFFCHILYFHSHTVHGRFYNTA